MNCDKCCCHEESEIEKLHIVILGGGSAAFSAAIKSTSLLAKVTIVNSRLPIGGCCVNVGCVPSKTLIRAAEAHYLASHHQFIGIEGNSRIKDFGKVIHQKSELVEHLRFEKYEKILEGLPDCRYLEGEATLLNNLNVKVLMRGGQIEMIQADRVIVATGSTPYIPPILGLKDCIFYTNETLFDMKELPTSIIVIGGGYVALECAQMLARFGSKVTILQRSHHILSRESSLLAETLANHLSEEGIQIVNNVTIHKCSQNNENEVSVVASVLGNHDPSEYTASCLLIAAGHVANTDGLNQSSIELDENGFVKVDATLATNVENVFAAGDVIGNPMFVYTAAYEGNLAAENAILNKHIPRDYMALPWVIFTDPQIAGVGFDEIQAKKQDIDYDSVTLPFSKVPRSIAARDTRGFVQLVRNRKNDTLVGARIIGHEASEMIMEISLAIKFGIRVRDLSACFHPYLTLSEGIKLAALGFQTDISKLSCCATGL